jgi:NADPH:quinone reductase
MKVAWYEAQGAARDVLVVGEMNDPQARVDEVRVRIAFSGVNPGDVKKREDAFGVGMPYPRVIPHSDGQEQLMQLVTECRGIGSVGVYGATALNPIVRSEPLPSTPWFR